MSTPLLRIPPKQTEQVHWEESLQDYIAHGYDEDPHQYTSEIETLSNLRNEMMSIIDHSDLHARDIFLNYFGQLELLELHFPIEQLNIPLTFKWYYTLEFYSSTFISISRSLSFLI
ncbi:bck1-like resistance to osmotic shock [Coelomomyces lativittatus]|nr:bck1-like resistance to osmotic shock [Coelomomyces lativittatus]KAJ1514203.1 bck1-like resistance to osmotic shock [Coelomomyces lativittatus]